MLEDNLAPGLWLIVLIGIWSDSMVIRIVWMGTRIVMVIWILGTSATWIVMVNWIGGTSAT